MTRELTCITCPIGCRLTIADSPAGPDGELSVSGNRCPRGAAYAREELLTPKRTVTATIRSRPSPEASTGAFVVGAGIRRIPCRTSAPFPKDRVDELLAAIYALWVPDRKVFYDVNLQGSRNMLWAAMPASNRLTSPTPPIRKRTTCSTCTTLLGPRAQPILDSS